LIDRLIDMQQVGKKVRNKFVTSWQLPGVRWSYGETCLMDFGRLLTPHTEGIVQSTNCPR